MFVGRDSAVCNEGANSKMLFSIYESSILPVKAFTGICVKEGK